MITVTINNSMSRVAGLTIKQFKELKEKLSYSIDASAAYFSGSRFNKRTLLGKRGDFPTGLLYVVYAYLDKTRAKHQVADLRKAPSKPVKRFSLYIDHGVYPEQEAAAYEACRAARGIIVMPTGVGKSLVAALLIDNLQLRTLVVVPSLELKKQLTKSFKTYFGDNPGVVGELGCDIAVENVDALNPDFVIDYDVVIIDEFHHSGAKTYRKLNKKAWKNVYYRFGLTATPFRSQDNERLLLESVLSEVVYKLTYQVAVSKGYIVPMEAYYIDLPGISIDGYTWGEVYGETVVRNKGRNSTIAELLNNLNNAKVATLCLVKEIQHGLQIQALTPAIHFVKGENLDNRITLLELNLGERHAIIGTTGVMGEGVDTKPIEYVIIAGLGKSKNAFMQQVGRGFRRYPGKESCKIIIFRDKSHKWTLAHFKAQCKILKDEYGIKPVKLALDTYQETVVL